MDLIAERIQNLTDARYFAAMGVAWMGFDLSSEQPALSIDQVIAMIDWVEGPQFFIDVRGLDNDHAFEIWNRCHPQGLLTDASLSAQEFQGAKLISESFDVDADVYILNESNEVARQKDNAEYWLRLADYSEERIETLKSSPHQGLILQGGAEDRTGMKSFDALNDFIEAFRGY